MDERPRGAPPLAGFANRPELRFNAAASRSPAASSRPSDRWSEWVAEMLSAAIGFWGLAVALKRTKETGILALGARVAPPARRARPRVVLPVPVKDVEGGACSELSLAARLRAVVTNNPIVKRTVEVPHCRRIGADGLAGVGDWAATGVASLSPVWCRLSRRSTVECDHCGHTLSSGRGRHRFGRGRGGLPCSGA